MLRVLCIALVGFLILPTAIEAAPLSCRGFRAISSLDDAISRPKPPECAAEVDDVLLSECQEEMSTYKQKMRDYLTCLKDESKSAVEEFNSAAAQFNSAAALSR